MSYELSHDPGRLDRDLVTRWITSSYWAQGRPAAVQEAAIDGSLNVGAYEGDAQVGYARMVTDQATFAWICDVYVADAHRGRGIARAMVRSLLDHPAAATVRRFMLATRDAHGVYGEIGFAPVATPERWMELYRDPPA